ncbi:MAG: hypothetical protein BJ554DRAFT_3092, partial [Olpidium bornovanus]
VFCEDCAESAFSAQPVCPACNTQLNNPLTCKTVLSRRIKKKRHDIVLTDLAPPEDFKASALAGLSPETILDIARRGVSFWSYQGVQESLYQKMIQQDLRERIQRLEVQLKGVVNDAQTQVGREYFGDVLSTVLCEKINALQSNLAEQRNRNQDMMEQYAEKDRQYVKLQELYDRLRKKTMVAAAAASGGSHLVNGLASCASDLNAQPGMNGPLTPMMTPQSPRPTTYPRPTMFGRTGQGAAPENQDGSDEPLHKRNFACESSFWRAHIGGICLQTPSLMTPGMWPTWALRAIVITHPPTIPRSRLVHPCKISTFKPPPMPTPTQ